MAGAIAPDVLLRDVISAAATQQTSGNRSNQISFHRRWGELSVSEFVAGPVRCHWTSMGGLCQQLEMQTGRQATCPSRTAEDGQWEDRTGGGSGHVQVGGTYVLYGRCGMLLLGCSKHSIACCVYQLAGTDVWGSHEDLVMTLITVRSHCVHNALQCKRAVVGVASFTDKAQSLPVTTMIFKVCSTPTGDHEHLRAVLASA